MGAQDGYHWACNIFAQFRKCICASGWRFWSSIGHCSCGGIRHLGLQVQEHSGIETRIWRDTVGALRIKSRVLGYSTTIIIGTPKIVLQLRNPIQRIRRRDVKRHATVTCGDEGAMHTTNAAQNSFWCNTHGPTWQTYNPSILGP